MHPIDAVQTARLTSDLQAIAQAAEHAQPLLLGVEQQGGLVGDSFRFAVQDTIDRTTLQPIRWCNQFACCDQKQWIKLCKDDSTNSSPQLQVPSPITPSSTHSLRSKIARNVNISREQQDWRLQR